jgi:hypothetical protein
MAAIRKPFQGVGNVIRFNWHFYLIALLIISLLIFVAYLLVGLTSEILIGMALVILLTSFASLIVSWYVYDASDLFKLNWLDNFIEPSVQNIANINAGFDEFSALIQQKFPDAKMDVFDFYNALKLKEVSIQRGQKRYPAYISTQPIDLKTLPLNSESCEAMFLLLAAHEIRDDEERIAFLRQ